MDIATAETQTNYESNIPAIVQAARQAIKGKLYKEFCAKKSLEKLCRVTFKPDSFIVGLNEALFSAKPIFPPVEQGDEVRLRIPGAKGVTGCFQDTDIRCGFL